MMRPGAMSRSQSRMATPLVNAEVAENVVKNTIYKNWKQIQQLCRQKDLDNSGTINVVDLKGIFCFHSSISCPFSLPLYFVTVCSGPIHNFSNSIWCIVGLN